jgi:hypothetical protein
MIGSHGYPWRNMNVMIQIAFMTAGYGTNLAIGAAPETSGSVTRVPVIFSGGHQTDPRDGGRPVALIAGALGVSSDVFRHAFSRVRPARAGTEPAPAQVRQNKAALMSELAPYGITSERLDTVSNYYRYHRSRGEMWPARPAVAYGLVRNGEIVGFEVTSGGSGYNTPPSVRVSGTIIGPVQVDMAWDKAMEKNGSIRSLTPLQKPVHGQTLETASASGPKSLP